MPLKILVLSSTEKRDGIADYTRQLFRPEFQAATQTQVEVFAIKPANLLGAPFKRADVVHIEHEFFIFDRLVGLSAMFFYPYLWVWSRLLGFKIITTIHSAYDVTNLVAQLPHFRKFHFLFPLLSLYLRFHYWLILHLSDRTILLTKAGIENLRRIVSDPFVKKRIRHIPLGNYTASIRPQSHGLLSKKFGISSSARIFTLFGFAFPSKGYEYGIYAMDILVNQRNRKDVRLLIVSGEIAKPGAPGGGQGGTYLEMLRKLSRERNLEKHVTFTGYLADNDPVLEEIFSDTTCFIFPYLDRAFASAAISTVLTAHRAVLVSRIKCFDDFEDLPSFPEKDSTALADKMEELATNPERLSEAVEIARHNAKKFAMDRIFARHLEIYREALAQK